MLTDREVAAVSAATARDANGLEQILGPDWQAVVRMVATLRAVPEGERRTDVLALVCRVYIAHPDLKPEP